MDIIIKQKCLLSYTNIIIIINVGKKYAKFYGNFDEFQEKWNVKQSICTLYHNNIMYYNCALYCYHLTIHCLIQLQTSVYNL